MSRLLVRQIRRGLNLVNKRQGSYDLSPQKAPDGTPYLTKRFKDEKGLIPQFSGQDEFRETEYWRNLYFITAPLQIFLVWYYIEHIADPDEMHPKREYQKDYDHLCIRTKQNFPWGTPKSMFHNKWTNRLPDGFEELTPEELAEVTHHH